MSKKTLKRRKKHASLDPLFNPRVRREYIDYDYTKQLPDEAKDFLDKFTSEYYGASISKYETKNGKKRVKKGHLHKTISKAKEAYDNNNRRNNDVYGVTKINGLLSTIDGQPDYIGIADYTKSEQAIIEAISVTEEAKQAYQELLVVLALKLYHQAQKVSRVQPSRKRRVS